MILPARHPHAIRGARCKPWILIGALLMRSPGVLDARMAVRIGRILLAVGVMSGAVLLVKDAPVDVVGSGEPPAPRRRR